MKQEEFDKLTNFPTLAKNFNVKTTHGTYSIIQKPAGPGSALWSILQLTDWQNVCQDLNRGM